MVTAAYAAWMRDVENGCATVLVAASSGDHQDLCTAYGRVGDLVDDGFGEVRVAQRAGQ